MKTRLIEWFMTRSRVLVLALLVGLSLVAPAMPGQAQTDVWVSVDKVMVNRLGGVNVSGWVDCSALVEPIRNGELSYPVEGEFGEEWVPLVVPSDTADDQYYLNLLANNDNFTVTQPAGRRLMISVTHGSSRMSPCLIQYEIPYYDASRCEEGGSPCQWESDHFGYDPGLLGPYFDYAPNGKFKAGTVNVSEESIGLDVTVVHVHNGVVVGTESYFIPEGSYAYTNLNIRAVAYRR